MQKRPLGRSGLTVSPVCFGGNVFGWTLDRKASFAMLDRCLGAGLNFIDSADVYSAWIPGNSGGESETLIGEWAADRRARDKMVIATKCGMDFRAGGPNLKPDYIRASVDASLKRLKTDYIDLFYAHRDDPDVPMADVLGTFGELIAAGKIRAIGASNFSAARLTEAMSVSAQLSGADGGGPRYTVLQNQYNLVERDFETDGVQQACARHDVAVAPYFALAAGFLTGKYRTLDDAGAGGHRGGIAKKYLEGNGPAVLAAMDAVAKETGASLSAIALAWLLRKPTVATPIASATKASHFEALLEGARLTLTNDQMKTLDAAGA